MLPIQSTPNVARKAEIVYIIKTLALNHNSCSNSHQNDSWWRPLLKTRNSGNPQDGNN